MLTWLKSRTVHPLIFYFVFLLTILAYTFVIVILTIQITTNFGTLGDDGYYRTSTDLLQQENKRLKDDLQISQNEQNKMGTQISFLQSIATQSPQRLTFQPKDQSGFYESLNFLKCFDTTCPLNFDKPTLSIPFSNSELGISFNVPFNPLWGNKFVKINPFEKIEDGIVFGYLGQGEGGGWLRSKSMRVVPQKSLEQTLASVKSNCEPAIVNPDVKTINGYSMVFSQCGALCSHSEVEIVGIKNNYQIGPWCGGSLQEVEEIARTVNLIN